MQKVILYIGSEIVDLFQDEQININCSVQDVNDISKVFTDYTQNFTVPASDKNNDIFKYYYNVDIDNGYNNLVKADARIELNYIPFRLGKVKLNKVNMTDGRPHSYDITFYGNVVKLSDVFGTDELSVFSGSSGSGYTNGELAYLDHPYDFNNVFYGARDGVVTGSDTNVYNGDIIYPLISTNRNWEYRPIYTDPNGVVGALDPNHVNIAWDALIPDGIDFYELKPAIQLYKLIIAIEQHYGITFSREFFGSSLFNGLYMYLNTEEGNVRTTSISNDNLNIGNRLPWYGEYDFQIVNRDYLELLGTQWGNIKIVPREGYTEVKYKVTIRYKMYPMTDYAEYDVVQDIKGTFDYDLPKYGSSIIPKYYTVYIQSDNFMLFDATAKTMTSDISHDYICKINFFNSKIEIWKNLPKLQVKDFFSAIIKMFNLVIVQDRTINTHFFVDTLDNWYGSDYGDINLSSQIYNITPYVDISNGTVSQQTLYKNIEFKYESNDTALNKKFRELSGGIDYGNIIYNTGADSSENLSITLPFTNIMFERLTTSLGDDTLIHAGKLIDADLKPVKVKPFLFFNRGQVELQPIWHIPNGNISASYYWSGPISFLERHNVSGSNVPSTTVTKHALDKYINIGQEDAIPLANEYVSLNFDSEISTWNLIEDTNCLYSRYYNNYITNIYNTKTRLYEYRAIIPLDLLIKLKLNDRLIISDKRYIINKFTTNLTTNETIFELINESGNYAFGEPIPIDPPDTTPPDPPIDLEIVAVGDTNMILHWSPGSTDSVSYDVYDTTVGQTYIKTVYGLWNNTTQITELSPFTNYCFQVSARDAAGNESDLSNQACAETTDSGDTTPPEIGTLSITSITYNSITLEWTAATDDIGVFGYYLYYQNPGETGFTQLDVGNTLTYIHGFLDMNSYHCYYVTAYDGAGNESDPSNIECATTLTDPSVYDLEDKEILFMSGTMISGSQNLIYDYNVGNVGIGTNTPSEQLELTENLKITNTTHANEFGIVYKGTGSFIHDFNYGNNGTITTTGHNTFLGLDAGNFTMGSIASAVHMASNNTGIGYNALNDLTNGYGNVAVGSLALTKDTTGHTNLAMGYYAMANNTTGNDNVALGYEALINNNSDQNVAIGAYTLMSNGAGTSNTAVGYYSMTNNATGSGNVAIGAYTLMSGTAGYNTAVGYNAINRNLIGTYNTAIGYDAIYGAISGSGYKNTAVGAQSQYSSSAGYENTSVGMNSLFGITTGFDNTAIGYGAGRFIGTGTSLNQTTDTSIYIGYDSRASANGVTNEIVIGNSGVGVGSNSTIIGNSATTKTILKGDVGIKTDSPGYNLDVSGSIATKTIRIIDGGTVDYILRSDANGNASWVDPTTLIPGGSGTTGASGASGYSGFSGYSGLNGAFSASGYSGKSGFSGRSGSVGASGYSGNQGIPGGNSQKFYYTSNSTMPIASTYINYSVGGTSYIYASNNNYYGVDVSSWLVLLAVNSYLTLTKESDPSVYAVCKITANSQYAAYVRFTVTNISSNFSASENDVFVLSYSETGQSGYSGKSGYSGAQGISGYSGLNGAAASSGYSGLNGASGYSGISGSNGQSGYSGATGNIGTSGYSGIAGSAGSSGYSGISGANGTNGSSGFSGKSGYSGSSAIVSGTANYIVKFASSSTLGNTTTPIYENASNISIGSTSPTARLSVVGSTGSLFDINGSYGELLSVYNAESGTLFSVNDISGIPVLKVDYEPTENIEKFITIAAYQYNLSTSDYFIASGLATLQAIPRASGHAAYFDYSIISNDTNHRAGTIIASWDDTTVTYTDFSTPNNGTEDVYFNVNSYGAEIRLDVTLPNKNVQVKVFTRIIN